MRYQKDSYSCGAAAVVNALRCFGKKVPERNVRAFSSTTQEKGTDEHGIIAALRGLGFDGQSFETEKSDEAVAGLATNMRKGHPVIICTQNLQHWVTVVGMAGDRFVVFDPARTKGNKSENGVHVYTHKQLSKTWQARNGKLFGVICKTK
jgi:ABC-type bacteriocin/lantibiotic exporter with double-glycine peptidase domain